jgi:hypothetical protein
MLSFGALQVLKMLSFGALQLLEMLSFGSLTTAGNVAIW